MKTFESVITEEEHYFAEARAVTIETVAKKIASAAREVVRTVLRNDKSFVDTNSDLYELNRLGEALVLACQDLENDLAPALGRISDMEEDELDAPVAGVLHIH